MEYQQMAKYYDLFYKKKNYDKESTFLENLINKRKTILDIGCGTGLHMHYLEEKNYQVEGIDLNQGMLDVAKTRVKGTLYQGNLLDFKPHKKYDAIISMFAVFNHLTNEQELEEALLHWYEYLNTNGVLIIDLHNGRKSGEKETTVNNYKRIMKWTFDSTTFKETTEITYMIDGKIYRDTHEFQIYKLRQLENILKKHNFKYQLYENYSFTKASDNSKNIEIVIEKE